jgi:hypothetical protein
MTTYILEPLNPPGYFPDIYGIDNNLDIRGYYSTNPEGFFANEYQTYTYSYSTGKYTYIPDPDLSGGATYITGISGSGLTVGTFETSGPIDASNYVSFIDTPAGIVSFDLNGLFPEGVNDSGEIVASNSSLNSNITLPGVVSTALDYIYQFNGTGASLVGTFSVANAATSSVGGIFGGWNVAGIDDKGDVFGSYADPFNPSVEHGFVGGQTIDDPNAYIYTDSTGTEFGGTYVTGVNSSGLIVGYYSTANGSIGFTDNNGVFSDVPAIPGGSSVFSLNRVDGVNDEGDLTLTSNYGYALAIPVQSIFTYGADTVDFNNLTDIQQASIAAGYEYYHGFGGGDTVTLPSLANYNVSTGSGTTRRRSPATRPRSLEPMAITSSTPASAMTKSPSTAMAAAP